uniref:Orf373 n=1 Tax=Amoebidium parasiticum TaxID=4881 RepID=Q8M0D4_AMOPA|nr:Orf373 [Amoebidium parasiticum]
MVTTQKIIERAMEYRGSKSVLYTVKEQRVDGSWQGDERPCLRYTLMDFERNYQLRVLSNPRSRHIHTKSTSIPLQTLTPFFVTGITDAEGCFSVGISKHKQLRTGWCVKPVFSITLHERDEALLKQLLSFFGKGGIFRHGPTTLQVRFESKNALWAVVKHFDKYPLISQKQADYLLWKKAVELFSDKEHLTLAGLFEVVALRASINWGLPPRLRKAFPLIASKIRPEVKKPVVPNPEWMAGFISGEGCFIVEILENKEMRLGYSVKIKFNIPQHKRDIILLQVLNEYLGGGGNFHQAKNRDVMEFRFQDFSIIDEQIVPFIRSFPIQGMKIHDFNDWCQAIDIVRRKGHLTPEGLAEIQKLEEGMNTGRKEKK